MVIAPNARYIGEFGIGIDADVVYRFHLVGVTRSTYMWQC